MPSYPATSKDTILYEEENVYGDKDITVTMLDGARLSVWGETWINGGLVTGAVTTFNSQTGTTYTLVLTDASKMVTLSNAAAIALTVPTNASVAFPVGTNVDLAQLGAGQVTVAGAGGVTVNATPTLKFRAQYSAATLIKMAADTWLLTGDLASS